MNNDYYITEDFTFNCLLYRIEDYLKDNINNIKDDKNLLSIFNEVSVLFNTVNEYTSERLLNIYNLIDSLGYYNNVKQNLTED